MNGAGCARRVACRPLRGTARLDTSSAGPGRALPYIAPMRFSVIALALVAACTTATSSAGTSADAPVPVQADPQPAAPVARVAVRDTATWVDSVMATLSPRQRIAQMVMFWVLGDFNSVDDSVFKEVVRWVEQEGVGGLTMSLGTPIEVDRKSTR